MEPLPVVDEAGVLLALAPAPGILSELAANYPDDFDDGDMDEVCTQNCPPPSFQSALLVAPASRLWRETGGREVGATETRKAHERRVGET